MEEENTYILRIICQSKSLFVPFKESELNITKFPEKVANVFGLKFGADVYSGLILTDNLGFAIPRNLLADVIKKFHNGSMFYINVEYEISDTRRGHFELVTPTILEDYFRRQNMSKYLKHKNDELLNDSVRKYVINCICDFMVESFGNGDPNKISKQQKSITCEAAIKLFIGLKSKDSANALSKLLGVGGYVNNRLKYLTSKYTDPNAKEVPNQQSDIETTPEEDLLFLKNCVIKNTDVSIIISKLNTTRDLRKNMMMNQDVDLRESFPYFFTDPKLIQIEFERNPEFECECNGLIEKWPTYISNIKQLFGGQVDHGWHSEIECLLLLLHIFPSRSCQLPLIDAINKLIVFRVVGTPPENMIENDNNHPYIVACGTSKKDIVSYYIETERHLFPLPFEFGILETFDIFFKLHHVFHMKFDKALENMIVFMQRLIYKLEKGKQSTANMKNVFEKLSSVL
ncbi:uncharacterized protein LOC116337077 [Contarinia nasturtii]|uniref:uncharacterized protein LOC116337077 n=1 Tax=Contarinia nasturtii TaxID=265458 RepID=UPI0012D42121|nr:uncharacterized protein LOC116337077 [Contarinia nasturtii]